MIRAAVPRTARFPCVVANLTGLEPASLQSFDHFGEGIDCHGSSTFIWKATVLTIAIVSSIFQPFLEYLSFNYVYVGFYLKSVRFIRQPLTTGCEQSKEQPQRQRGKHFYHVALLRCGQKRH